MTWGTLYKIGTIKGGAISLLNLKYFKKKKLAWGTLYKTGTIKSGAISLLNLGNFLKKKFDMTPSPRYLI